MKNKQVIKALTVGISASMLLNPVVAFASDLSQDDSPIVNNDGDKAGESVETSDKEEAEKELKDAETDLVIAADSVKEADNVEGTEYTEAKSAIEKAHEDIKDAETDIGKADDAFEAEKKSKGIIDDSLDKVDDEFNKADDAINESMKASQEAVDKDAAVNVDTTSEAAAQNAMQDIENDLKIADGKLKEAEGNLTDAENELASASEEYKTLEANEKTSETELSNAKQKVIEAETALEEAQKNVEANAKVLNDQVNKLAVYDEMATLKNEIAAMSSEDPGYTDKIEKLSELIVQYYLIGEVDDGSVEFGVESKEFVTGYDKDENGEIDPEKPIKSVVNYKTVTYTVNGEQKQKIIEYGQDNSGVVTVVEKTISAKEETVAVLDEEIVYTNEDGKEYVETETSYAIPKNPEKEDEGFFAIDTSTSTVLSEEDILPSEGDTIEVKGDDGNSFITTITEIAIKDDSKESISYELEDDGISVVISNQYDVKYGVKTQHTDKKEYEGDFFAKMEACDAYEQELRDLYGDDNFTLIEADIVDDGFVISYYLKEEKSDVMTLASSKTIYKMDEYIDRSPAPVYVDKDGNQYVADDTNIVVYKDPENTKLGFYAVENYDQLLDEEYSDPSDSTVYERDEQGRLKETSYEYSQAPGIKTNYSKEKFTLVTGTKTEKSVEVLGTDDSLYDFLNKYQGKSNVTIILKGANSSETDYVVDFKQRSWYEDAEKEYAIIAEKFGGCVIEIEKKIPLTQEMTGVVEKQNGNYLVDYEAGYYDSRSGICSTKEEAEEAIKAIAKEILSTAYSFKEESRSITEVELEDGSTGWKYVVDYYAATERIDNTPETLPIYTAYYDYTEYLNSAAKVFKVYTVLETIKDSVSANNENLVGTISQKLAEYNKAKQAKEKVDAATQKYMNALDAVKSAKTAVESLELAKAPQTVLDEAIARLNAAKNKLESTKEKKTQAEVAFEKAQQSLESIENKLKAIREKRSSEGSGGSSSTIPGNVADSGVVTTTGEETIALAASSSPVAAQTSTIQTTPDAGQGAVLGATRARDDKAVRTSSKKGTEEKADETKDNAKEDKQTKSTSDSDKTLKDDNSSVSDNTSSDTNENVQQVTTIKENDVPLVATPVEAGNPFLKILLAVIAGAAVAISVITSVFFKNKS